MSKSSPITQEIVEPIAVSSAMRRVLDMADEVAPTPTTVLLLGESGTGKEVIARRIHNMSSVSSGPWVAVNSAALPSELVESELFGHEKGAFTGADERRIGRFEQADGGTLLLDEISELPLSLQAKLLRVIQEREVVRVGAKEAVRVNIRILATSNRNLKQEVKEGRFRDDLFYRLNVFPIQIPPLREREDEIGALARCLLANACQRHGKDMPALSQSALGALRRHDWPGNVRELGNVVERALIRCRGGIIDVEHLGSGYATIQPQTNTWEELPLHLPTLERLAIIEALKRTEGNRTHAAKILGIGLRTLRNKLTRFKEVDGIDRRAIKESRESRTLSWRVA